MINLLYISAAIVAIAFTVLVVYVAKTLKATERTLSNVSNTLEGLEKQMEGITVETTALLNKTNGIAEDLGEKTQKFNSVFEGVKDVGDSIQQFNKSVRSISTNITDSVEKNSDKAAQALQWGNVAIDFWNKVKGSKTRRIEK